MKTATSSALRSRLSDYINQSEPVVVTHHGRRRAVFVPVQDDDDIDHLLYPGSDLMKILEASYKSIQEKGGIPHDEFWALVDARYGSLSNTGTRRKKRRK